MSKQVLGPDLRSAPKPKEKHSSDEGFNALISLGVAGGLIVGVLVVGGIYWALSGGSKHAEQVAAETTPQSPPPPATPPEKPPAAEPTDVPQAAAATPETVTEPTGLTRMEIDPRIIAFKLASPTFAMAYDPTTGRIALIDDKLGGVAFYDVEQLLAGKVEPKQVLKTEGPATAVCFKAFDKNRYFAVASKRLSLIRLYEADTFAQVAEAAVTDTYRVGYLIAGQSVADPYIGYAFRGRTNNLPPTREVRQSGRIDLRTMKDDDAFTTSHNDHNDVLDGAISPDGSMFYYRGFNSPKGRVTMEWHAPSYTTYPNGRVLDEHEDANDYITDAFGNAVSYGLKLYSRDMRGEPQTLEFEPRAYFRAQPVVVGVKGNDLVLGSSNDYRQLATVPMPAEWARARNFQENWYDRRQREEGEERDFRQRSDLCYASEPKFLSVAADDARKVAIVVFKDGVVLVPLDKFQLPPQPSLAVHVVPAFDQYVDEQLSAPLETGSSNATFEVVSFTAKGSQPTVNGKTLKWTPTADQVGVQRLKMRARDGEATHEWEWPFRVQQRSLEIPFSVTGISVEPKAKKQAVVWGYIEKSIGGKQPDFEHYLGVVDLTTRKLTAQRKLSRPVTMAAIGSNAVYAIAANGFDDKNRRPKNGTQLGVLRLPDLTPDNHTTFPSEATRCAVIADKFLVATGDAVWRYTLPDLKRIDDPINGARDAANYSRTRDGWLWDGVYWDDDFKTPQLLSVPVYFAKFDARNDELAEIPIGPKELPGHLEFDNGPNLMLKPLHPTGREKPESLPAIRLLPKIGLPRETESHEFMQPYSVDYGNGCAAVIYKGQLFITPFSDFHADATEPFHFELTQSTLVLNPAKPTKVTYQAKGARSYILELRLAPKSNPPLFTESSNDGTFTIDVRKFGERIVGQAIDVAVGEYWRRDQTEGKGLEKLQDYVKSTTKPFHEIAKHNPKGVPVLLFATVTADTAGEPSAKLHHAYLMEVPSALVRDALERNKSKR